MFVTDWIGRNCSIRRGGCNFDDGYGKCEFSTSPVIDYSWKERSGQTPNLGTGPTGDHTTGNGKPLILKCSLISKFLN